MKLFKKLKTIITIAASLALGFLPSTNVLAQDLLTLDIALAGEAKANQLDANSYNADMGLYGAVYEPLVKYENGNFTTGIAESWQVSEDGKSYTFKLGDNHYFSNGDQVDAEAVKFSIERAKAINPDSSLETLSYLDEVVVEDEKTVTVKLTQASNQILNEMCQTRPLRIMSPKAVEGEKVDGEFIEPIGSGPFKLEEASTESAKFTPNSYYNSSQPVNYQVVFKTISDASSRVMALQSGEVDVVGGVFGQLSPSDVESSQNNDKLTVHEFSGTESHFLAFDPNNDKLTPNIRKAIAYGVDKTLLSDKELKGLFQENVQYVNSENQKEIPYDPKKAEELIEEEGYKKDDSGNYQKDGETLELNLVIQTAEYPDWKRKAEILQSELAKIGVVININQQEMETYYDTLWTTKEYDLIFYRTYTDALLPYNFLDSLYVSSEEGAGVLADNKELTGLLNKFPSLVEEDEQQAAMDEIFTILNDEMLGMPIEYVGVTLATNDTVSKLEFSGLSDAPIDFSSVELSE